MTRKSFRRGNTIWEIYDYELNKFLKQMEDQIWQQVPPQEHNSSVPYFNKNRIKKGLTTAQKMKVFIFIHNLDNAEIVQWT